MRKKRRKLSGITAICLCHYRLAADHSSSSRTYSRISSKVGKVGNILLAVDQLIFEITKTVEKAPKFFLQKEKDFSNDFFPPINYLSCLLFILMYLFCKLLFGCTLITHFFVMHQIIKQRLKKLNRDIVHSTERENTVRIGSESAFSGIETKTKKNAQYSRCA